MTLREKSRERNRRYRERHRERVNARSRAWYRDNAAQHNGLVTARRRADPEPARAVWRRWAAKNGHVLRKRARTRRARDHSAYVELVDELVLLEMDDGVCGICGEDVDPFAYEVDHIVPIARGGDHSYANTQPAHGTCNRRKGARWDWPE